MIPADQLDRSKLYKAERLVIAAAQSARIVDAIFGKLPKTARLPLLVDELIAGGDDEIDRCVDAFMKSKNAPTHAIAYLLAQAELLRIARARGLKTTIDLARLCEPRVAARS